MVQDHEKILLLHGCVLGIKSLAIDWKSRLKLFPKRVPIACLCPRSFFFFLHLEPVFLQGTQRESTFWFSDPSFDTHAHTHTPIPMVVDCTRWSPVCPIHCSNFRLVLFRFLGHSKRVCLNGAYPVLVVNTSICRWILTFANWVSPVSVPLEDLNIMNKTGDTQLAKFRQLV